LATFELPNVAGMPPDQVALDSARPGVPVAKRMPGLVWNTQANQTLWPAVTDTGVCRATVCQPWELLTVVALVTPRRVPGRPELSP